MTPRTRIDANQGQTLSGAPAAFTLAAGIAIVFNTLLAWVKDSSPAVNSFMASLTGHHWRRHGLVDLILFFALGFFFMARRVAISGNALAAWIAAAVIVGDGGLALWFMLT
jgi:hypothetical protein